MTTPTADAFAALARSSPWRWSTLRFTVRWPRGGGQPGPVRAWLRRPDRLRVEGPGGALVRVVREPPQRVSVLTLGGGTPVVEPWPQAAPGPRLRADGLVAERPFGLSYDAPFYENYFWIAMLDPVELADGRDPDSGEPDGPALLVDELAEVDHGGRPAWEAVVRPTPEYDPRCGCCPLLRTREVDLLEFADHPEHLRSAYPDAYRVRLDVGTGICVQTAEIGGLDPGMRHDIRIEAVDEPMDDDLFVPPRRGPFRRRSGWSPVP